MNTCHFCFISIRSSSLCQVPLWLFKSAISGDVCFRLLGGFGMEVAPHNSNIFALLLLYIRNILPFSFLTEMNCFTLVSIIVIIFSLAKSCLPLRLYFLSSFTFVSAGELVNSFIFHEKLTAIATLRHTHTKKNTSSLFVAYKVKILKSFVSGKLFRNVRKFSAIMGLLVKLPQVPSVLWNPFSHTYCNSLHNFLCT